MNWKRLALPVLAALLLVPHGSPAAPKKTFVMVPKGVHPYYEPCYEGFKAAAKKYDVNVDKVDPQKFELPLQVKAIEELIAQRVDGIAISALDDAGLVPVIAEATRAGIKVITFDAPAPSSQALTYIGTDNKTAGYEAGKKPRASAAELPVSAMTSPILESDRPPTPFLYRNFTRPPLMWGQPPRLSGGAKLRSARMHAAPVYPLERPTPYAARLNPKQHLCVVAFFRNCGRMALTKAQRPAA